MATMRVRVYVIGPYSAGDVTANVTRALELGNRLLDLGFAPLVPHLSHFWHGCYPRPYETWMQLDLALLRGCHAVLWDREAVPGPSPGGQREWREAGRWGLPRFRSVQDLLAIWPRGCIEMIPDRKCRQGGLHVQSRSSRAKHRCRVGHPRRMLPGPVPGRGPGPG